jgi:fluoride exporter
MTILIVVLRLMIPAYSPQDESALFFVVKPFCSAWEILRRFRMKKYLSIGIGGALGAIARHFIQQVPLPFAAVYKPILTMLINISGSFLLGFLLILFVKCLPVKSEIRLGITTGFLGGYTTFSTLCKESVMLCFSGHIILSVIYVAASVLLGLAAAWLGIIAAKHIERRRVS